MNKNPYRNSAEYKKKRNEYMRKYYEDKYAKKQIENNQKYRNEKRKWASNLKAKLKCSYCFESDPNCLDFHHTNPSEKNHNISAMIGHGYSKKVILSEIKKCAVICANCHRKHHANNKN